MAFDAALLEKCARKYVWWKTPEDAATRPDRVAAQVMNIGDYDDVRSLIHAAGVAYLRDVLIHAEAGQFSPRSWTYWHYRLYLSEPGIVPALPKR